MHIRYILLLTLIALLLVIYWNQLSDSVERVSTYMRVRLGGDKTVSDRIETFGYSVEQRLRPEFNRNSVAYPPKYVSLLAFKDSNTLELYAGEAHLNQRLVKRYHILGASGVLGPKLREGDRQVPEGIYRIESLNPNSLYHVSLRLNYPNDFDRRMGENDGRAQLGGDIMIHGSDLSIGCLAVGNDAAEELFYLAASTHLENITVIISPTDFRLSDRFASLPKEPEWVHTLYDEIKLALSKFE